MHVCVWLCVWLCVCVSRQAKLAEQQAALDERTSEFEYAQRTFALAKEKFDNAKATVKKMKKMRAPPHKVRFHCPLFCVRMWRMVERLCMPVRALPRP